MKKLLIALAAFALLLSINITETTYAFPAYYQADFSEGIPDDWEVENAGSVTSDGTQTTIYSNEDGEEFDLYSDIELPQGFYEIKLNGWYGSDNYGSDNSLLYELYYEDFSEIDGAELSYTHESFTFLIGQYTEQNLERIQLSFDGGYSAGPDASDYMQIESVEINRVLNVDSYDYLSDFEGDVDTTIRTIDQPSKMTEENLSDATIYGVDERGRGEIKLVERGDAVNGETYETAQSSYKASWEDEGGDIFLYYDSYYDAEQGDVVLNNMDSYPYNVIVILHDESLEEEDDFAYPLEDYYYFEYEITADDIDNLTAMEPVLGNIDNINVNRLAYANILLNDTDIVRKGAIVDNEVLSHTFDWYRKGYDTDEDLFGFGEDESSGAFFQISADYYGNLREPGDVMVANLDEPDEGESHTLEIYLPKDVRDFETPGYDEPGEDTNPNAPGGFQDILTYFGLWNTAGVLFLFAVIVIGTNIGISILGLNGVAVIIADVVILSLFLYMNLLPIWIAAVLIPIFIAIFIMTLKGGGIVE